MLCVYSNHLKLKIIKSLFKISSETCGKCFHTSTIRCLFYEPNRRIGYPSISDHKKENLNPLQRIYKGYFQLIEESTKVMEDIKDRLNMDPMHVAIPGEVDVQWKFDDDPNIIEKWIVTCDSDYDHGYSKAVLSLSPTGTGVFSGVIDTRTPKDGKISRAGFCNIRSVQRRGPFKTRKPYVWIGYTHLILRIRGDGRSYMINLHLHNFFDVAWADLHSFPLYTRGGPYWQYVKIPFSKFLFSNRGRIQDSQMPVRLWEIEAIGITATEIAGPFRLEIDYIGVVNDLTHTEQFAYEMYKPPFSFYI